MGGLMKAHAAVLLIPVLLLSIVTIGLTGYTYDTYFNPNKDLYGNDVSSTLMSYTGPAATLAIAAVIAGVWYVIDKAESWVSAAAAFSTALVAWAFGLVAFGFACKHASVGNRAPFGSDYISDYSLAGQLKGLSGVTIVLFIFETAYVILLKLANDGSSVFAG
ncbi:hypothetical protein R1sor_007781 [Riccia sorocarpa]|uniref:Uncharacterized protein n=1 Tax=Riccia sorocarpa TaxID=122646 RepID=A0ABD3HVL9_9MARC